MKQYFWDAEKWSCFYYVWKRRTRVGVVKHLSEDAFVSMASFYFLQSSKNLVGHVLQSIQNAEDARQQETNACCKIQAMARMVAMRKRYVLKRTACIHIQRIFRFCLSFSIFSLCVSIPPFF